MPEINKILFVSLSNIGDCILSLPALDLLIRDFPQAQITVVCGRRPKELFENNPHIRRVVVFDRRAKIGEKIKLFRDLKKEKFGLVVDLRNSLFGALLGRRLSFPFRRVTFNKTHMRDRHLEKLGEKTGTVSGFFHEKNRKRSHVINIRKDDEEYIDQILKQNEIEEHDKIIAIAPGARSHIKRWPQDRFVELISAIAAQYKAKMILIGDKDDAPINKYIAGRSAPGTLVDFSSRTNLRQLAALLQRSSLLITNDSATLHLASYLNRPIVAIFGPTNEFKYGPWSEAGAVVKKNIHCRPCEKAQCKFGNIKCMESIQVGDVMRQVRKILQKTGADSKKRSPVFQRILIVRTDRIGDVLLSTPVIKALRENYPDAFIAMMVAPYAKEIVEGNPYLDEVITFDKDSRQRGWWRFLRFVHCLKKKRFDLAIILHPTNRVHLAVYQAGIPRRVGYSRKYGFLLTDKIAHTKQLGAKHESEYNLDLIRYLGINAGDEGLFMPVSQEVETWAQNILRGAGIGPSDKLLAIHPGASCPSKIWPNERFAEAADKLIDKYGFKALIIAGPKDTALAQKLAKHMRHPALNLAGKTSVSQMAGILKRCRLFISNDSGPVHIASALGVPVISIFGRAQLGLSPRRWGPLGKRGRILHKDVGCLECLAHNCAKGFLCLMAITVMDVLDCASSLLREGE